MGVRSLSRFVFTGFLLFGANAHAAVDTSSCTPTSSFNAWINSTTPLSTTSGAATAPAADTPYIPPGRPLSCAGGTRACGRLYFAKGVTLFSFEDRGTTTQAVFTWGIPGAGLMGGIGVGETASGSLTMQNFPSATPTGGANPLVVYVGGDNGFLYKVDGQSNCIIGGGPYPTGCSNGVAPLLFKDLRRKDVNGALICNTPPGDRVAATPAVILNAYSPTNGAFQSFAASQGHTGADLIFAATYDGCGDHTHNAIHAIWSDNFAEQLDSAGNVFYQGTDSGDKVDAFTDGCLIRYEKGPRSTCGANNPTCADPNDPVIFCGTLLNTSVSGQDSVFELNAITTGGNKRVVWSHNAGSLSNRPMLNNNSSLGQRLYVANQNGTMFSYGPDGNGLGGPDIKWSYAVAPGSTINRSPWIEPRGGTFKDKILVLDTAGILRAYQDNGSTTGPAIWSQASSGTANWISLAVVLPGSGSSYAYIGRNDGYLQQVDLAGGSQQGKQQVDSNAAVGAFVGDMVFDPSLDIQDSGTFVLNRAYVVDDGVSGPNTNRSLKRFKLPFCTDSGGSGNPASCGFQSDGVNTCFAWNGTGGNGSGSNPCVAMACDPLKGNNCEWSRVVPAGNDVNGSGLVLAPDGIACDDGSQCTQAPSAPAPINCNTSDDCPHTDVFLQGCQCTGGSSTACDGLGGRSATTCSNDAGCVGDLAHPRCGSNGFCQALCSAPTTANAGQTLPLATIGVNTTVGQFPQSGTIFVETTNGLQTVTYTGVTTTSFTGCSGGTGSTSIIGSGRLANVYPGSPAATATTSAGSLPTGTLNVGSTAGYPLQGYVIVQTTTGETTVGYTNTTATSFTGVVGGQGSFASGAQVSQPYNTCQTCTPQTQRVYFMKCSGPGGTCLCNNGDPNRTHCNDICLSGKCTGSNSAGCSCVSPGDRACAVGSTCCGVNNGGCVDVTSNPQHCGSCGSDCGAYSVPASTTVSGIAVLLPQSTINVAGTASFPSSGTLQIATNGTPAIQTLTYTGTTPTTFTGVGGGTATIAAGDVVLAPAAASCITNNDCGSCANDGACQSAGINSRCEDIIAGTGHCGRCSVDCSCFFSSDCTNKGYGGATCVGGDIANNVLGTCTGGTPACVGYCKRLTNTGHCTNGVCDVCAGGGSCSCNFPSTSDFNTAAVSGLSSVAFERITGGNPQTCSAFVSAYNDNIATQNSACGSGCDPRTSCVGGLCRYNGIERIDQGAAETMYTSNDFRPLNGVSVPLSGWDVLANAVGTSTSNPPPWLSEVAHGATTFNGVVSGTSLAATGADLPFHQAKLNDGMVGPAVDTIIFTDSTATTHQAYFGNYNKLGDVVQVTWNGTSWTANPYAAYSPNKVSCNGGCGAAVPCDSPSSGHGKSCSATVPDCVASGAASACIGGHCRCAAPQTCGSTGTCSCVAPATCNGSGVCQCPHNPTETCDGSNFCSCGTTDSNCGVGGSCVNGRCADRVTALAVGGVQDSHHVTQRKLVVGHGSILSIVDMSSGAQTDVNLATAYVPAPSTNQATINGILSVAIHPQYGDIWALVKGTNNFRFIINIDAGDNSCRHGLTVQKSYQHSQSPVNAIPADFGSTADGHLVFMPDSMLMYYETVVDGVGPAPQAFKVCK